MAELVSLTGPESRILSTLIHIRTDSTADCRINLIISVFPLLGQYPTKPIPYYAV